MIGYKASIDDTVKALDDAVEKLIRKLTPILNELEKQQAVGILSGRDAQKFPELKKIEALTSAAVDYLGSD